MATTTNYSWTTPDDTDLVKDGAAAIRTLGSSIDTSVKALSPGTTAGDVDYYTTSTAKARLGIGTAGQVLQVNSGATAPEWATPSSGGMTLISTTTLSGATTTLSSIPQTYNSLFLIITGVTGNTSNNQPRCLINNTTNLHSYSRVNASVASSEENSRINFCYNNTLRTNANNAWALQINNYTSTSTHKPFTFNGVYIRDNGDENYTFAGGGYRSNSAITSIVLDYGGVNTFAGGTVLLYGVK
jgi:hypothetical protein